MRIYTSYFGNLRNIPDEIYPISIARYTPKGMNISSYPPLFPSESLLRSYKTGDILSTDRYIETYKLENLRWLNPDLVRDDLMILSGGKDVVLLCYEKWDFCHREIIRPWFGKNMIEVVEY